MFYVYIITCNIDDGIYLGKTNNIKTRWAAHKLSAKKDVPYHLYNSIRKYGINSYSMEAFEEYELESDAYDAEVFWIAYYKSFGAKILNETVGGRGGMTGRKVSEETKAKHRESAKTLSICQKGRIFSEEERSFQSS